MDIFRKQVGIRIWVVPEIALKMCELASLAVLTSVGRCMVRLALGQLVARCYVWFFSELVCPVGEGALISVQVPFAKFLQSSVFRLDLKPTSGFLGCSSSSWTEFVRSVTVMNTFSGGGGKLVGTKGRASRLNACSFVSSSECILYAVETSWW